MEDPNVYDQLVVVPKLAEQLACDHSFIYEIGLDEFSHDEKIQKLSLVIGFVLAMYNTAQSIFKSDEYETLDDKFIELIYSRIHLMPELIQSRPKIRDYAKECYSEAKRKSDESEHKWNDMTLYEQFFEICVCVFQEEMKLDRPDLHVLMPGRVETAALSIMALTFKAVFSELKWELFEFKEQAEGIEKLLQKAVISLRSGEYENALYCFNKVLEKNNRVVKAWYWTAHCHRELGHNQEAIKALQKAVQIDPGHENAWNDLGATYSEIGCHEKATEALKQAVLIKPDLAEAHCNLGNAYAALGLNQEAIESYKQAIHIKPDFAGFHRNLGITYGELGLYEKAAEAYKQVIRINPDCREAYDKLGLAYAHLGRLLEAIEAYKQAIRIDPDNATTHCSLGVIYGTLGAYEEEITTLKQAIQIQSDYPDAHYFLGSAYLLIGDKSSAIGEYKILKTLDEDRANELFNEINQ